MSKDPILILQMQRMGDLILSFPLIIWLQRLYPGHPIWVVAEEDFFKALMPVAPHAVFFPPSALPRMYGQNFHLVINLSHRPEAAMLGTKITSDAWVGPRHSGKATYIHGAWQLYRASLTHNNRHNRFHWADLNLLDVVPFKSLTKSVWVPEDRQIESQKKIGLFLGASEESKRPTAEFWANLAQNLLQRGLDPVLLGGTAERPLGTEVANRIKATHLNLCGRFSVPELVEFTSKLSILITPDTGPMHLADWLGIDVLNLSMGNVNPWDTGPRQQGHYVLRSSISCRGCWQCTQDVIKCRESFSPQRIAMLVHSILNSSTKKDAQEKTAKLTLPSQELFFTSHKNGLYHLKPSAPLIGINGHLGDFWQNFFAVLFNIYPQTAFAAAWQNIKIEAPSLCAKFTKQLSVIARELSLSLKKNAPLPASFWQNTPLFLRPFASYIHIFLQNSDYSREAYLQIMESIDFLRCTVEK